VNPCDLAFILLLVAKLVATRSPEVPPFEGVRGRPRGAVHGSTHPASGSSRTGAWRSAFGRAQTNGAARRGPVGRAPRHRGAHDEATTQHVLALDVELDELRAAVVWLQAENERLLRLLRLSPQEAAAPGPAQSGMIDRPPGPVHARSDPATKVAFFRAMFACRQDASMPRAGRKPAPAGRVGAGGSWWLPEGQRSVQAPRRAPGYLSLGFPDPR